MFLEIDTKDKNTIAAIDDEGRSITYGELCGFCDEFYYLIGKRTLIFILAENTVGSFAGYIASLSDKIVPLILSCSTERGLLNNLLSLYKPEYLWIPARMTGIFEYSPIFSKYDYTLVKTNFFTYELYQELSLLLPTSGSTGSPKLVRHSYRNVEANARNVSLLFELTKDERAIVILPMHYTMGLSVISSHIYAGASILLIKSNLTDKKFWNFIKQERATSFTGVPFSYEILHKLRFFRMDLPDLRIITQGGGKLSSSLFQECAEYAHTTDKKFIATYGQTEGTARMAFLSPELALHKNGSIGKAIPNGELFLVDETDTVINDNNITGQMVFKGENVTLGYALTGEDLIKEDENHGMLYTGDIAHRDDDGCYFIVGRMKRFLKIYGFRISLDEIEYLIKSKFSIDCCCSGSDELLTIMIDDNTQIEEISEFIIKKTGLFHKSFKIAKIDKIERNESGKISYSTE
jgi:acyl-coenzyme A synthetase/AMP-(fatty) acid ligase